MTIEEMRVKLAVFCHDIGSLEDPCENCPVNNIDNVCEDFNWKNAPERLVEKAYQAMKGEKTMNITADDIRKAALELIGDAAQCEYEYSGADALSAKVAIGYIVGAKDFAEKMIEMIEEGEENDEKRNA